MTHTVGRDLPGIVANDYEIKANGAKVSADVTGDIISINVEQALYLPSMAELRMLYFDPTTRTYPDSTIGNTFEIGNELEIKFGYVDNLTAVFKGEITAVEFSYPTGEIPGLVVRAYDKLHRLQRGRKVRAFVDKSHSDIISQLFQENGLSVAVDSTTPVLKHTIQTNESDYDFIQRLANLNGLELHSTATGSYEVKKMSTGGPVATISPEHDLLDLTVRVNTSDQVDKVTVRNWDPKQKQAIVGNSEAATNAYKPSAAYNGKTGKAASSSFGTHEMLVVNYAVQDQSEAQNFAKAIFDDLAGRFIQVEGSCQGQGLLTAGKKAKIENIGKFAGEYYLTRVSHRYTGRTGYVSHFEANSRQSNTILELTSQHSSNNRSIEGPIIGLVTDLNDPDNVGRIKIKFPTFDENVVSAWARVATPMAGNSRGFYFMPEVNDEVLVVFEHGDPNRPIMIGGLYSNTDKVPEYSGKGVDGGVVKHRYVKSKLGHIIAFDETDDKPSINIIDKTTKNKIIIDSTENTITIESDKDIKLVAKNGLISLEAKNIEMKTTENVKVEATQNIQFKATQDFKVEATGNVDMKATQGFKVEATMNAQIKGTAGVKLDAGGGKLELTPASASLDGGAMTEIKGGMVKIN